MRRRRPPLRRHCRAKTEHLTRAGIGYGINCGDDLLLPATVLSLCGRLSREGVRAARAPRAPVLRHDRLSPRSAIVARPVFSALHLAAHPAQRGPGHPFHDGSRPDRRREGAASLRRYHRIRAIAEVGDEIEPCGGGQSVAAAGAIDCQRDAGDHTASWPRDLAAQERGPCAETTG